jgi:hypothetical protein
VVSGGEFGKGITIQAVGTLFAAMIIAFVAVLVGVGTSRTSDIKQS